METRPSNIVALWCWYHGGSFRGYQSQPEGPTVQETVLKGLRSAGFERNPVPSGRTDLGVHARMQVLSMRVVEGVTPAAVAPRLNPHLPETVGIALSKPASPRFNAAWSAAGKEYRYRLALGEVPGWEQAAWRVDVKPERLAALLGAAVGTRDFFAFHDKSSPVRRRTLERADVVDLGKGLVDVRLVGDAFGRFMVRYLVGTAVAVARGELEEERYLAALSSPGPIGAKKAPALGLVLWEVRYPPHLDPFTPQERAGAKGVPRTPPFLEGA